MSSSNIPIKPKLENKRRMSIHIEFEDDDDKEESKPIKPIRPSLSPEPQGCCCGLFNCGTIIHGNNNKQEKQINPNVNPTINI